jgi:hypothetical protein
MKQAKTKQRLFTKRNELMMLAFSAAFSFTLLLFSPVAVYMDDPASFMLDFRTLAPLLLAEALVGTVLVFGLLNLMLRIHKWAYLFFSRLLMGIILAGTVQVLFINGRTKIVLRNDVRYGEYKAGIIADSVIFWVIAALPFTAAVLAEIFPEKKLLRCAKGWGAVVMSALLMTVHMGIACVRTVTVDFSKYNGIQNCYLSYEPTLSLSEDGNVVVFLVDRLDSLWMDDILERYPELEEELSGFTFYQNALSTGTSTFPTVPQMLTNCEYDGDEWHDYLSEAWSGDTLPAKLKENGYDVYLLPDRITTLGSPAQVMEQCDNIKEYSCKMKPDTAGRRGVWVTMLRLSAARLAPYDLKKPITYWLGGNFCRFMIKDPDCGEDYLLHQTLTDHDLRYNSYLRSHSITADNENRTFSFIHLSGCHTVDKRLADIHGYTGELDIYKTVRGDFDTLSEYFSQMKAAGVYDSSTVIIMGDHGRAPRELKGRCEELSSPITTAVLIKPAGAEDVPLERNSEAELSLAYFSDSILEYAGISHSGTSFDDVISGKVSSKRYIRGYDFAGYGCMVWKAAYEVSGSARDGENWTRLDE